MSAGESDRIVQSPSSVKTGKWPKFKASGGPGPVDMKFEQDGRDVSRIYRAEIIMDVKDAVRVTTYQFGEVVVDLNEPSIEERWIAQIVQRTRVNTEGDESVLAGELIAKATGKTLPEALRTLAVMVEEHDGASA